MSYITNIFDLQSIDLLFISSSLIITINAAAAAKQNIKKNKLIYIFLLLLIFISFSAAVSTESWLIFMIAWELITLFSSMLLIWDNKKLALQYFIIQFAGGSILLFTVIFSYISGYSNIVLIENNLLQYLFVISVGAKSAVIGFHIWMPYIYKKSSNIFCAVSSSVIANLGYIILLKITADSSRPLMYLAFIMIFYGAIKALEVESYRMVLTYSSISQFGLIMLGIAAGNYYGYLGAAFQMAAHSLSKSILFLIPENYISGSNIRLKDKFSISTFNEKAVSTAFIISVFSLMAVPFFFGYSSKYLIKNSLAESGLFRFLLHAVSVLSISYLFKIIWLFFYRGSENSIFENSKTENRINHLRTLLLFLASIILIIIPNYTDIFSDIKLQFDIADAAANFILYSAAAFTIFYPIKSRADNN